MERELVFIFKNQDYRSFCVRFHSVLLWCYIYYFCDNKTFSLAYKTTLEKQYFLDSDPKVEVISSKIDQLAAI